MAQSSILWRTHARRVAVRIIAALALCAVSHPVGLVAQSAPSAAGPIAVYLDCRAGCDGSLIRSEITYVNWVRDREVADIHVLVTSQRSGAGGEQFAVAFLGARGFVGRGDTLTFTTSPTTTGDESRRGVMRTIANGLVPFVARTAVGQSLRVVRDEKAGGVAGAQMAPGRDPWKAWVFSVSLNGSTDGERYYKSQSLFSHLSADRVTDDWKTNFDFTHSYRDNQVTVQEYDSAGAVSLEETYANLQRDWRMELLQVKSLSSHWSLGGNFEMASQTFRNQDLRVMARAAMEYNIFPYAQATRRELMLRYGVGVTSYRYADTTIFDKIRETLPSHFFEVEYRTREPWGSANVTIEHRNFLNDASKRTTDASFGFNVRVFRGFSISAGGGYEWIRDQVYLPRGEQSTVDVLLRRRALLSGFQYSMRMGLSYTFGSIYNNVVNPRF